MEELLLAVPLSQPERHRRMFYRLKDFRRIATRYDRNAMNFLAAVCIAATVVTGYESGPKIRPLLSILTSYSRDR